VTLIQAKQQKFDSPAAGANDFAFRLSKALLQNNGKTNFVSSPYSVWLPLAALVNATNPAHKAALLNALGAAGFSENELNEAAAQMLSSLTNGQGTKYDNEYYHNPLRIANAIFVDKSVTLNKNFKKTFADSYQGSAQTVDFKSPSAVKTVNDWASKHTDGLIKDIIQEFDPDTVAAIANAIYFSDRWAAEFDPDLTKKDTFHGANGDTQAQFMFREGDVSAYYENSKLQAVSLNFKSGGGMSILLPKDGDANTLLSGMTSSAYEKIQSESEKATGKLLLPRFEIDSGVMKLIPTLAALGVPLADPRLNALNGLIDGEAGYISDALQRAVIEVDEKGATAAAVTVITTWKGMTSTQPAAEPFNMVCDRPFAFILYGKDGQILFIGVVNQIK
jgi:serpin B